MAKHRPPAYLHHRLWNRGYCRIKGKQFYFPGEYNSAEFRAAYDAKVEDWRRSADRQKFPLLIADFCAKYSDHAVGYYRPLPFPVWRLAGSVPLRRHDLGAGGHLAYGQHRLPVLV